MSFYKVLTNSVVSQVTNMSVWFGLIFFVYLETRSVFATSIVSGIYLVAVALSGFWLGGFVDRFRKKIIMLLSSAFSLVIYVLGLSLYLAVGRAEFSDPGSPFLWTMVPLLLIGVIAGNIRAIAIPTLVTVMVPEDRRDKANGIVGTATGISFMIVSVISGLLVGIDGMLWVLGFAIGMTLLALIHLWSIPIHEKRIVHKEGQQKLDIKGTLAVVSAIPGLFALIFFTTFNNFLGGVFMGLMDAYGLSLVPVQVWGLLWGFLSLGFIVGGMMIARFGLGTNPLRSMFIANLTIWSVSSIFTIQPSILLLTAGMFIYLCVVPYIEASEHTIIQKLVPQERQGRVFGFAQSVEMAASPLTAFLVGPLAQFFFIPFMTSGAGVDLIGSWFGTGPDRGMALLFTIAGIIGLFMTIVAMNSKYYRELSERYTQPRTCTLGVDC